MDLLMYVGKQYYTLGSFISEASTRGVSKRIPATMIPDIEFGKDRLFLAYPEATVLTSDYKGLTEKLCRLGLLDNSRLGEEWAQTEWILDPAQPIPQFMLTVRLALETCEKETPDHYRQLVQDYAIRYQPGIFGYTYLTAVEYVLEDDEEDLPQNLQHLKGLVTPIRVVTAESEEEDE